MTDRLMNGAKQVSLWIFLGLLAYMPLHIFLSTWLGSSFGILDIAKVAKDIVLVIGFLLALVISWRQSWFKQLIRDKLIWLIVAYAALTVLLAALKPTDQDAEVLGVVFNTRFLLFFIYGMMLVKLFPKTNLQFKAIKTVLIAGAVVITFGIAQYLFIPDSALTHVGYSKANGVLPAFLIDEKPDLERVMSSLRDPNSLGSYLIIIGAVAAAVLAATKRRKTEIQISVYLTLAAFCLWFTFSRSAVLGALAAAATFMFLSEKRLVNMVRKHQNELLIGTIIAALVLLGGLFVARDTYLVQNVVLHSDQSGEEDSNQQRLRAWKESVLVAVLEPEGTGPGTAGPASMHNDIQGASLNENYYLQILAEVGVVGLTLFLAVLAGVARRLYLYRESQLVIGLLAAFVGLALTNLFVHIWSNEAVAYTWWGLAGIVLVSKEIHKKGGKSRGRSAK